jgi:hypothetical protein
MAEIRVNATGELKLYDSDDSNYVSFKSAGTVSSDVAWTLPSADGSSGQMLSTNGSGTLSWATASSADPTSADGDSLGTASAEWSDLYLADGGIIYFGNDQEITLTHSADSGLLLKHTATADDKPINLVLQTGETDMAADDVIGKISWQAPDEGTGTDAILVSAAIQAVAEGDFSSSSNATRLEFMTGSSEAATSQMSISSGGIVGIGAVPTGDLGVGLHIKTADSGQSAAQGDADELVIEGSGSAGLTILSGTSSEGSIHFGDSGASDQAQIMYNHNGDYMMFRANNGERMRIISGGQVGVGTTAPGSARMNVQQNTNELYYGKNDSSGQFSVTSAGVISATNTTVQSISDERLKKDIADFSGGLNIVKAMKPKTYKWKNPQYHNDKDDTQYGFVAQELLTISNAEKMNMVIVDDANTMMYENEKDLLTDGKAHISGYQEKDAIYVSAVKELSAKVDTLETENTALKARVKTLEDA